MSCRACAIGIEVKSPPEDFWKLLEEQCKERVSENRRSLKAGMSAANCHELNSLVEAIKIFAAEKTDFPFSAEVEKLIESCEQLPKKAQNVLAGTPDLFLDGLKAHELALNYFSNNQTELALQELNNIRKYAKKLPGIYKNLANIIQLSDDQCLKTMMTLASETGSLRSLRIKKDFLQIQLEKKTKEEIANDPITLEKQNKLIALEQRIKLLVRWDDKVSFLGKPSCCLKNLVCDSKFMCLYSKNLTDYIDNMECVVKENIEDWFFSEWRSSYLYWRSVVDVNKFMIAAFALSP